MQIVLTLLIGLCGGLAALKLKLPAGGLIGAMIAVGAFKLMNYQLQLPSHFMFAGQVLIGSFIGLGISRQMIMEMRDLFIPALVLVLLVTAAGLVTGLAVYKLTSLDIGTALFSGSPGGITNMAAISQSMGVNARIVTYMQTIRVIALIIMQPLILKMLWSLGLK